MTGDGSVYVLFESDNRPYYKMDLVPLLTHIGIHIRTGKRPRFYHVCLGTVHLDNTTDVSSLSMDGVSVITVRCDEALVPIENYNTFTQVKLPSTYYHEATYMMDILYDARTRSKVVDYVRMFLTGNHKDSLGYTLVSCMFPIQRLLRLDPNVVKYPDELYSYVTSIGNQHDRQSR